MTKTKELIEAHQEASQGPGSLREHLGASIVGDECSRKVWYIFRWFTRVRFKARLLRLFDRGNREEERFTMMLRRAGVHVLDRNPETGKQFQIQDHGGHFGGSLDALIFDAPDMPNEWILGEYKTHNDKSFKEVVSKGVMRAKWVHYVQMQIYMYKMGLRAALYFAVNKNDDDLHIEVVYLDTSVAERYLERAGRIIEMREPPPRISESAAWYLCKFCDMAGVCHRGDTPAINCRTCIHSIPTSDGTWFCGYHNQPLPESVQKAGCQHHTPIRG